MIRLIIIRFSESIARNFFLIITPAIVVTLVAIALQFFQKPQFLSGAAVQIRYNHEISKVIGYEKFETNPADPAERMIWELQELLQTDVFVDKIIDRVDFTDHTGVNPISNRRSDMREYIRDNVELLQTGLTQVGIVVTMPTYTSSVDVVNAIYDEYLTHQVETFGGTGRDLVEFMSIYLDAKVRQRDQVNAELDAYLKSHPEHPFYKRREIEEAQIALLVAARDDLTEDIEYTKDILDLGFLVEGTSERYFKETFILLDAPFEPVPLSTTTKKLSNIIQGGAVGVFLSILTIGLFAMFDRRVTLPLDLKNTTDLPLLTMVEMEKDGQKQRYKFRTKRIPLWQRLKNQIRQTFVAGGYNGQRRSRQPNKNLNSAR